MSATHRRFRHISPTEFSAITVLPPGHSQSGPCHFGSKPGSFFIPTSATGRPPFPPFFIPPSTVSAIISSNKQSVIDRKLKRKAETHKTIPCRAWKDTGRCNYGSRCKFAHGDEDLRKVPEEPAKIFNNPRYRTELCVKYHLLGSCPYGERCSYIHEPTPQIDLEKCLSELSPPSSPSKDEAPSANENVLEPSGRNISTVDFENLDLTSELIQSDVKDKTESDVGRNRFPTTFHDPFTTDDEKENIELKLLPFMESFLKRPFYVR